MYYAKTYLLPSYWSISLSHSHSSAYTHTHSLCVCKFTCNTRLGTLSRIIRARVYNRQTREFSSGTDLNVMNASEKCWNIYTKFAIHLFKLCSNDVSDFAASSFVYVDFFLALSLSLSVASFFMILESHAYHDITTYSHYRRSPIHTMILIVNNCRIYRTTRSFAIYFSFWLTAETKSQILHFYDCLSIYCWWLRWFRFRFSIHVGFGVDVDVFVVATAVFFIIFFICVCGFLVFFIRKCRWNCWNLRLGISVVKQLSAECAFKIAFCVLFFFFLFLQMVKDWDKFRTIQRNVKIVFVSTFPEQILFFLFFFLFFSLDEWKIPSEIFFNIK